MCCVFVCVLRYNCLNRGNAGHTWRVGPTLAYKIGDAPVSDVGGGEGTYTLTSCILPRPTSIRQYNGRSKLHSTVVYTATDLNQLQGKKNTTYTMTPSWMNV
jgi:hypothetical protein